MFVITALNFKTDKVLQTLCRLNSHIFKLETIVTLLSRQKITLASFFLKAKTAGIKFTSLTRGYGYGISNVRKTQCLPCCNINIQM